MKVKVQPALALCGSRDGNFPPAEQASVGIAPLVICIFIRAGQFPLKQTSHLLMCFFSTINVLLSIEEDVEMPLIYFFKR